MRYFIYCRKSSEAEDRQVLSIESQLSTLHRTFPPNAGIEVAGIYEEAFSAKAPGRMRFDEMMRRIEAGEARGIISWAPDRLARNSIDGGRIIYLLDQGILRDLKFATYSFENNSQGKFMLQIMFGQSKYYSDALSENVRRGNQTKVERGWRPNLAPLGYLNDPVTKTIITDPVHFPLIRKMFDMMLSGNYTPKQIARIARTEWGFRTPRRRRIGGVPLAMSSIYKILGNPFYAGVIVWSGASYPGRHEPVISLGEFQRVRKLLETPSRPRPQKHAFAFTGMIRCGGCGMMVTAEGKRNRYGHRYVYYHCSKSRPDARCQERSIELRALQDQALQFLRTLAIAPEIEAWVNEVLANDTEDEASYQRACRLSLERSLDEIGEQLDELTDLRTRRLISDEEFTKRRSRLQQDELQLRQRLTLDTKEDSLLEPVSNVVSLRNRAADWFANGDDNSKRLILRTVASNLVLRDKKLIFEAAKPFFVDPKLALHPRLLGAVEEARTSCPAGIRRWLDKMMIALRIERGTKRGAQRLEDLKTVQERFRASSAAPFRRLARPRAHKG